MTNTITYLYHSTFFFNPVQSPVRMLGLSENHTRLPALLSPVPRRRDAHREENSEQATASAPFYTPDPSLDTVG